MEIINTYIHSIVQKRHEYGIRIDTLNKNRRHALHYAARKGNREVFELILNCFKEDKCGIDQSTGSNGNTPFYEAYRNGNIEILKLIVELKSSQLQSQSDEKPSLAELGLDEPDHALGSTPFLDACRQGNIEIVKFLFELKPDITRIDSMGFNILHQSIMNRRNPEVFEFLHKVSGSIIKDLIFHAQNIVHYACLKGNLKAVQILIKDENCSELFHSRDNRGWTPLHCACSNGKADIVKVLLTKEGIEINAKNNQGQTPRDLLVPKNQDIIELLDFAKLFLLT